MGGGRSKPRRQGARPPPETFQQLFNGSKEWFKAQPNLNLADTMILTAQDAVNLRPVYDEKPKRVYKPTKDSSARMSEPMNVNLLCAACWCGDFEMVKLFVDRGVPVWCPESRSEQARDGTASSTAGCSALHCVIMTPRPVSSRYEIAEYLLKSANVKEWIDARVNSFDDATALECAMQQGNTPLAGLLINRGAGLTTNKGKNVLAMVAASGNKLLLECVLSNLQITQQPEFRRNCEAAAFAFTNRRQLQTYLDFLSKNGLCLFDESFSWPLQFFSQTAAVEEFISLGAKEPSPDMVLLAARTIAASKKHTTKSMLSMDVLVFSLRMQIDSAIRRGLAELCMNVLTRLNVHINDSKVNTLILGYAYNYVEPVSEEKKDEKEEKAVEEKKEACSSIDYQEDTESKYEQELLQKATVLEIDADVDCREQEDIFTDNPDVSDRAWANFVIVDDPLIRPLPAYIDGDLRKSLFQNMREPPPRVEEVVEDQPIEDDSEEEKHTPSPSSSSSSSSSLLSSSSSLSPPPVTKPAFLHQPSYVMMDNSELASMQNSLVQELMDVMGLSDSEVAKLLSHYNGNKQVILSKWFSDSEQVRSVVGLAAETKRRLTLESKLREQDVLSCQLCEDSVPYDQTYALSCQHRYCLDCWKGWMDAAYDKGPAAAFTCCMANNCRLVVPREFWNKILDPERRDKFETWCTSVFVKNNVFVKWCPAAKCGRAVSYQQGGTKTIQCECGLNFCFSCLEEDHRPCSCALVAKWREKNQSEGENANWILANCKICPKCKSPIEKNQGCDHMTCRREAGGCGHEFCWLCKKDWKGHTNCAQFGSADAQEEQKKANDASAVLKLYTHHFTRWSSHLESSRFADVQRNKIQAKIDSMRLVDPILTDNYIMFIYSAAQTVQACRRILAWSHALAYFLPKDSYKELFETHQSQLGAFVEQLNSFTEGRVEDLVDRRFREKTMNLNRVTQKFRDNVLDFCDINYTHWANVESKSNSQLEVKCKNGHSVIRFEATNTYNCDVCKTSVYSGAMLWGCRQCDYDYCKDCHSKARRKLKSELGSSSPVITSHDSTEKQEPDELPVSSDENAPTATSVSLSFPAAV